MIEKRYIPYITKTGDRWCDLAHPSLISKLISENPHIPILDILPAGLTIWIPITDESPVEIDTTNLPPWRS